MKKLLLLCSFFLFSMIAYSQDVWLQNHFSPNSGFRLSNAETVTVLVNNNSGITMLANTITVKYQVDNGTIVSQPLSSNLTAGASWNFSFSTKADLSAFGSHIIKVWVERPGDLNSLNNELTWTVNNACIEMNQPSNVSACNGTNTSAVNFTSNLANVTYTWTNSNPSIGLAANGVGNLPSFNAVNTGTAPITGTITVVPKIETFNQTFNYTGNIVDFVVPASVTSITISAKGAQGGNTSGSDGVANGGLGAVITSTFNVTPGHTLKILVGQQPVSATNASGGGGGTFVWDSSAGNTLLIAAGGGGGGAVTAFGCNCPRNGVNASLTTSGTKGGGGLGGEGTGGNGGGAVPGAANNVYGGGGAGWLSNGIAATTNGNCPQLSTAAFSPLNGGAAGTSAGGPWGTAVNGNGGFGGGGGAMGFCGGQGGGGGGGGYSGGAGANYTVSPNLSFGGGGGGSYSSVTPTSTAVNQTGSGQVVISYSIDCGSTYNKTFVYTVNPTPTVVQPADQTVFAGGKVSAINFSSLTTGGTVNYEWTNDVPAIGLATSGTGNVPAFTATNTTNAPLTATITVTPKFTDSSDPSAASCNGTPQTFKIIVKPLLPDANGIIYVKKGSNGTGESWTNPTAELADALVAAKSLNTVTANKVKQIWVAGGTYKPMYSPEDGANFGTDKSRDNAFLLVKDVKVYGGFAGTESILANRDLTLVTNQSILSGDIDGNDVLNNGLSATINGNNSYHVVVAAGAMGTAALDGFNITGGNANATGQLTINTELVVKNNGGGLTNTNAILALSNLNIAYNKASFAGGGIYNIRSATLNISRTNINNNNATINGGGIFSDSFGSSLHLNNVVVSGNKADGNGGGVCDYSITGNSSFTNVLISGNTANTWGGGLYSGSATTAIINTAIVANIAGTGGGVHNEMRSPLIVNSIIFGNSSGINNNNGTPVIKNSLVQGLTSTANGNIDATDILLANVFVSPLTAGLNSGGDYRLKLGSPVINVGDNTLFPSLDANTKDLDGNARLVGNNIDLGPYESSIQPQTITAANLSRTYGDADFEPGATASSGLAVSYASADNSIAEAYQDVNDGNKWKLKIKKVGTINVTASQAGGNGYAAAPDKVFVLTIQPKALTVTATGNDKIYDATTNAVVNLSSNALAGDVVTLAYTSATFGDDNVGNNKTIIINGISLSGTDAGNYTFNTTASTMANITPFALTVSATGNNRVYNAMNNATVNLSSNAFAGDNLTLSYVSAAFNNKTVANGKAVSVSGISLSGTDAGNYTFNTTASTTANITPSALTVSATANNKIYDATNNATVDLSSNAFAGDNLILAYTSAAFSDKVVANGKTVSVSGISLSGTDAGNYTFNTTASATANITPFALTVSATANNRVYNATNNATVDLSSNAFAGDNLTLAYSSATFNDRTVANGKTVSVSGISLSGTDAGNYTFNTTASATANITPFVLTVSATGNNRVYDATNNATVNLSSNAFASDNLILAYVLATFGDENVGNNKTVTVNGISLSGTDAGNYTLNTTASSTANITPFALTISATGNNRVYNAMNNATVNLSSNAFAGDNLTLSYVSAAFNNKTVANGKPVSVSGISLSGTDAGNYTFNTTASTTANITPFALTVSATGNNKVYDGTNNATVNLSSNAFAGDVVTLAYASAIFNSRDVANNKTVSISGISLSGTDAGNYTFGTTASATAAITPATLNIVAQARAKTYGDADPALTYAPTGLIGADAIVGSLARTSGENVGTYAITQGTLSAGTNYVVSFTGASLAINRATLTVTAANAARCYGQANPSFSLNYNGFRFSDNENSLATRPQATTTANASSAAGSYPITVSGGSSANYTLVYANGSLRVDALPNVSIVPSRQGAIGRGLTLQLMASGGNSYSWASADGIISGQNGATLTIRPTANTTYTVTVTNNNGCSSTASYAVAVEDDLSILKATNLLSPNGDGVNDVWKVDNMDMYPRAVVRIFDKAGRVVYTKRGYDNTWDGTYNGQPLAENTYYYTIDLEAGKVLRGYITLVRDR